MAILSSGRQTTHEKLVATRDQRMKYMMDKDRTSGLSPTDKEAYEKFPATYIEVSSKTRAHFSSAVDERMHTKGPLNHLFSKCVPMEKLTVSSQVGILEHED